MTKVSAVEAAGRDSNPLRKIGQGQCSSVWASSTRGPAFKREDGGPGRSLESDFEMHQRILRSFQRVRNLPEGWDGRIKAPSAHIPVCHTFIGIENQDRWSFNLARFPSQYTPCNMIQSQRIPPFAEKTRELLVDTYCCPSEEDHALRDEILMREPNKDCVIRP
ncbi:hypothetical protein N7490_006397 [Penicillium lividum]|nr:hypothetical protein N7490_006397 [Penicillium lividum]